MIKLFLCTIFRRRRQTILQQIGLQNETWPPCPRLISRHCQNRRQPFLSGGRLDARLGRRQKEHVYPETFGFGQKDILLTQIMIRFQYTHCSLIRFLFIYWSSCAIPPFVEWNTVEKNTGNSVPLFLKTALFFLSGLKILTFFNFFSTAFPFLVLICLYCRSYTCRSPNCACSASVWLIINAYHD